MYTLDKRTIYVFEGNRGLWFEDGVFKKILPPGRYEIPFDINFGLGFLRRPKVEIRQIDIRERDLTIKGQEILTADKVAIRVSIIVQFKVTDPRAALLEVENYQERLYGDVQLAARRSLASMSLEQILTNRNSLSEDILRDIKEKAQSFGVVILRADVKDLVFPGDVQEIMNRVLKAERVSQAQLVEAKSRAEIQLIEAKTNSEKEIIETQMKAKMHEIMAESDARAFQVKTAAEIKAERERTEAEIAAMKQKEQATEMMHKFPELLRLKELEALKELAKSAQARIYIGFDKYLTDRTKDR